MDYFLGSLDKVGFGQDISDEDLSVSNEFAGLNSSFIVSRRTSIDEPSREDVETAALAFENNLRRILLDPDDRALIVKFLLSSGA